MCIVSVKAYHKKELVYNKVVYCGTNEERANRVVELALANIKNGVFSKKCNIHITKTAIDENGYIYKEVGYVR